LSTNLIGKKQKGRKNSGINIEGVSAASNNYSVTKKQSH